jgi:hypothetical protein
LVPNLAALASYDARAQIETYLKSERCVIDYRELLDEEDDSILRQAGFLEIIRRFRVTKSSRPWWEPFATYAREKGGGNLNRIISAFIEESST